jgi:hypothetical protein
MFESLNIFRKLLITYNYYYNFKMSCCSVTDVFRVTTKFCSIEPDLLVYSAFENHGLSRRSIRGKESARIPSMWPKNINQYTGNETSRATIENYL